MDPPLSTWIASTPDLVTIEYHTSFPYVGDPFYQANIPEQENRVLYYPITFVPSIRMDGPHAPAQTNPTAYENLYQQRRAIASRVDLELGGTYDPGPRTGQVKATVIAQQSLPGAWRLRIAITESDIHYNAPNGINIHDHVFRRFVPDTTGTAMTFGGPFPDTVTVSLPFTVSAAWAEMNVSLIAFLQEQGSREIEQGAALAVPDLPVVAVGGGETPAAPALDRLEPLSPNPFAHGGRIRFELARGGQALLTVHDPAGRLVRVMVDAALGAGHHSAAWDGLDGAGRPVGSGVYLIRLTGPSATVTRKVLLMR